MQCAEVITNAAERVQSNCTAILANQMQTPIKNAATARNTAHKIFMGVAGKIDGVRKRTEQTIAALDASTLPPTPKDATAALYAQEIRAALLRMPQAERTKAVTQAINDGDDAFVAAAVLGNVALCGLGKAEQTALADAWRRKRHGATVARIESLRSGLTEFNRLSSCYRAGHSPYVPNKTKGSLPQRRARGWHKRPWRDVAENFAFACELQPPLWGRANDGPRFSPPCVGHGRRRGPALRRPFIELQQEAY